MTALLRPRGGEERGDGCVVAARGAGRSMATAALLRPRAGRGTAMEALLQLEGRGVARRRCFGPKVGRSTEMALLRPEGRGGARR